VIIIIKFVTVPLTKFLDFW
jgi:hypothetical protein